MGNSNSVTVNHHHKIKSIESIINAVTQKKFDVSNKHREYKTFKMDEDPEDEIKPLKTVATDIVVEQFFQTESTLYRFLNVVYSNFNEALKMYRDMKGIKENDLFFLYKGGNILRFVSHEFLKEIPASANEEIHKFYAPYFKRSDADFAIYISPYVDNYDTVHYDMGLIAYLLQHRIRSIFLADPGRYFDFLRYSKEYKDKVLAEYFPKFNSVEGFKFDNLSFLDSNSNKHDGNMYLTQPDFAIEFLNDTPSNVEMAGNFRMGTRANIYDSDSFMTVSHNDALTFYTGLNKDRKSHFTLVRTKIFFTLTRDDNSQIKVGGELIDVGIDYTDDVKNVHLVENFKQSIADYEIDHDECKLKFKSYTIDHLVYDLEEILFEKAKYPWFDPKYNKRINRLFYFYFVDIFMKISNGDDRLDVLRTFKNTILIKYRNGKIPTSDIKKFKSKYGKYNLELSHMLTLLPGLYSLVDDDESVIEMNKFLDLLIVNADFTIKTLEKVKSYCKNDGKVKSSDIYKGSAADLL